MTIWLQELWTLLPSFARTLNPGNGSNVLGPFGGHLHNGSIDPLINWSIEWLRKKQTAPSIITTTRRRNKERLRSNRIAHNFNIDQLTNWRIEGKTNTINNNSNKRHKGCWRLRLNRTAHNINIDRLRNWLIDCSTKVARRFFKMDNWQNSANFHKHLNIYHIFQTYLFHSYFILV